MRILTLARPNTTALAVGCAGALLLLTLVSRSGAAEKQPADDCLNHKDAVCRMVESCTPKGFETNGTCAWTYTVSRSYWKY
jgi:hypothetical protein